MPDGFAAIDEPANVDKKIATESRIIGGETVQLQRIRIAGDTDRYVDTDGDAMRVGDYYDAGEMVADLTLARGATGTLTFGNPVHVVYVDLLTNSVVRINPFGVASATVGIELNKASGRMSVRVPVTTSSVSVCAIEPATVNAYGLRRS